MQHAQRVTMKIYATVLWCACAALSSHMAYATEDSLKCFNGPIAEDYGHVPWLVYGCDDGKSLVIVSGRGNPAVPFYFMVTIETGSLHIRGEGSGSKGASDAALADIKKLDERDIQSLIAQSSKMKPSPQATPSP